MAPTPSTLAAAPLLGGRWAPRAPRWSCPVSFYHLAVFAAVVFALQVAAVPTVDVHAQAAAASRAVAGNIVDGCVATYDPNVDYFPDKVAATYADQFTVNYYKHYKIVNNTVAKEAYLLVQCGTPTPPEYADLKTFQVPVRNVSVESTTAVTFIELLGRRTSIRLISYPSFFTSPCIQRMVADGSIGAISTNATEAAEQLSGMEVHFAEVSAAPAEPNYVAFSSALDPGPLERAEWIDFVSTFYNLEAKSNSVFGQIQEEYSIHADNGELYMNRPLVAWTSYQLAWWDNNREYWEISQATYKLELADDAGGNSLVVSGTGQYDDVNAFHAALANVDILIDETYLVSSYPDLLNNYRMNTSSNFKFMTNKKIYREDGWLNPSDAQDWFEGAIAQPNAVLQSLMGVVQPRYPWKGPGRWFRNLPNNEPITQFTADQCTGDVADSRPLLEAPGEPGIGDSDQTSAAVPLTAYTAAATLAAAALAALVLA